VLKGKFHYFDLLWICCTTNPQQQIVIEVTEFALYCEFCDILQSRLTRWAIISARQHNAI